MDARVAVIVGSKGRGSNMERLVLAGRAREYPGHVALVVSPSLDAPAVARATELGVPAVYVARGERYGCRLAQALEGMDLVCLAGYMWLLPTEVLRAFPGRVLNIHPALLPRFGGKGMYGHHVHEAVVAAGETVSGCTVHYVTEQYDEGATILQRRYLLAPGETPESLAAAILRLEHEAYPEAVARVLGG